VVLLAFFTIRSRRHTSPVIDLSLFRIRSFSVANAGALLFGVGFFAQLLNGVLFLTDAWGYSALAAGFALTPGPIAATLCAPVAGRLADRFGHRVIAVPGGVLFGLGTLLLATSTGTDTDYLGTFLPGIVLAGAGVGFALPGFGSAAVSELPPTRFATGIAISSCFRQLGAVIGVAGLVAVLDAASTPLAGAHQAWILISAAGLASAVAGAALGRARARAAEPTPHATTVPDPS
jgi:MFS family permease